MYASGKSLSWTIRLLAFCILAAMGTSRAVAQDQGDPAPPEFKWERGPTTASLGSLAKIQLSSEFAFLHADETRRLMAYYDNIPTNIEVGTVVMADDPWGWFLVFEFENVGYVKDDDRGDLKPDKMLKEFKSADRDANAERQKLGISALNTVGWKVPPHYDQQSNNLEWCLELESEGKPVLNHNIRVLGRHGVMRVTLVCSPDEFDAALAKTRVALAGFDFTSGNRYAEWTSGDKVATYGLTALVTGGAVAVAAKSGLLGKLLKPLIYGGVLVFAVVAGFLKKIWAKITGRSEETAS